MLPALMPLYAGEQHRRVCLRNMVNASSQESSFARQLLSFSSCELFSLADIYRRFATRSASWHRQNDEGSRQGVTQGIEITVTTQGGGGQSQSRPSPRNFVFGRRWA